MRYSDVVRLNFGEDIPVTYDPTVMVGPVTPEPETLAFLAEQNRMREMKAKLWWAPYALGGVALLIIVPMLMRKQGGALGGCHSRRRRRR